MNKAREEVWRSHFFMGYIKFLLNFATKTYLLYELNFHIVPSQCRAGKGLRGKKHRTPVKSLKIAQNV